MKVVEIQEPIEALAINHDRMRDRVQTLSVPEAEDFFFDTVEDIAQAIGRLEQCLDVGNVTSIYSVAESVHKMADAAGFMLLAQVALDLQVAIRASDHAALHAIGVRMMRVGEQSLLAMWDSRAYS